MSHDINPRGQKRKAEDGRGYSDYPDKRLREKRDCGPNGELYWVVQWYVRIQAVTFR